MKDDMKIEMEANKNQQLERIAEFMENNSKVSNSTGLEEENERLKKQLKDYENALKKYADEKNWNEDLGGNYNFHYKEKYQPKTFEGFLECVFDYHIAPTIYNGLSLAQETLEKWENK